MATPARTPVSPEKEKKSLFSHYQIEWTFLTSLCSSVPANPDIVQAWLKAREPRVRPAGGKSIGDIQEEVAATIISEPEERAEQEQRSFLVFQRFNDDLVMRAATVRAHIKDCARIISREHVGKIKGEASFSTRIINCVYHDERQYWLPILDSSGKPFKEPTGTKEKPVRTFYGNALKSMEYVIGAHLHFRLKVLGGNISEQDLATLFEYGGVHGYGGERGDGEGRYVCKIKKEKNE